MYLQLAEGLSLTNTTRSNIKHQNYMGARGKKKTHVIKTPTKYEVTGYWRERNYVAPHERRYLNDSPVENPYIFIPDFTNGGGLYVREDKFDSMPDEQWAVFMQNLAPYQHEVELGVSENEFLSNRADRKKRREGRQERRKERTDSKAEARKTKAEAKLNKSEKGGIDWSKAGDTAKDLIGNIFGKKDAPADGTSPDPGETPFYKKPAVIVGGLVLLGGAIYLGTRKKK